MQRFLFTFQLLALLAAMVSCQARPYPRLVEARVPESVTVLRFEHPIENLYQISDRLYSGSQPERVGLIQLEELGIKTIISVDGMPPDVEAARARGMRTIHIPFGYDGVPQDKALLLAQAISQTKGKVFIHCHHGKHRGPAAAAICAMTEQGWSPQEAIAWMKQAGTSSDYPGLYESVEAFERPADDLLAQPATLPERVSVPPLAAVMVKIDELWDQLKADQQSQFPIRVVVDSLGPRNGSYAEGAVLIAEHFREAARTQEAVDRGQDFVNRLQRADAEATSLTEAFKRLDAERTEANLKQANEDATLVGQSCKTCHARYRN